MGERGKQINLLNELKLKFFNVCSKDSVYSLHEFCVRAFWMGKKRMFHDPLTQDSPLTTWNNLLTTSHDFESFDGAN